jgi:uncharacterized protein YifN (PemK superfamily)
MPLKIHPQLGTVVICDFQGLNEPEMTKRRLAVVVTPFIRVRPGLCTVVPFSTTAPLPPRDYHCAIQMDPPLPAPYDSPLQWVKGDMIYTLSLGRLSLPFDGKSDDGKRNYDVRVLSEDELIRVRKCMLHGLGMAHLTKHI